MSDHPLQYNEVKNTALQALLKVDYHSLRKMLNINFEENVIKFQNKYGNKIKMNDVIKEVISSLSNSLSIFCNTTSNKCQSSPFYSDSTPSFIFNDEVDSFYQGFHYYKQTFYHFSDRPCGDRKSVV